VEAGEAALVHRFAHKDTCPVPTQFMAVATAQPLHRARFAAFCRRLSEQICIVTAASLRHLSVERGAKI